MDGDAVAGTTGVVASAPAPPAWLARGTAVLVPLAVVFAWYRGFRLPNIWSVTLETVSVTDGFHRRFLVGTAMRPIAVLVDFHYWLFATFSLLVLVRSEEHTSELQSQSNLVCRLLL